MKRTLYLHIGSPKTATTTIQQGLEEHVSFYQRNGYSVCKGNLLNNDGFANNVSSGKVGLVRQYFNRNINEKYNKYILSCEHLFWAPMNYVSPNNPNKLLDYSSAIKLLHKVAFEYFQDVRIIVYLRPQAELINSMYMQDVQFMYSGTAKELEQRFEFNYFYLLNIWKNIFKKENIIVRNFPLVLSANTPLKDFNTQIGIVQNIDNIQIKNEIHNLTITSELFYFKREFNKIFETIRFKPNGINFIFYGYLEELLKQDIANGKASHIELSESNCLDIDSKYKTSNIELFKEFNVEGYDSFNSKSLQVKSNKFLTPVFNNEVFMDTLIRFINVMGKEKHIEVYEKILKIKRNRTNITTSQKREYCEKIFFSEYDELEKSRGMVIEIQKEKFSFIRKCKEFLKWTKN